MDFERPKNTPDSARELKEKSTEDLWKNKEYGTIIQRLTKEHPRNQIGWGGFSDYDYDVDKVAATFGLKELIGEDGTVAELEEKLQNPKHFLVGRKKREIIMEHLIPLLEKLPTISWDEGQQPTEGGELELSSEIDEDDLRSVIERLIYTGLCTTQGSGTKMINVSTKDVQTMISQLKERRGGISRTIVEKVRGKELRLIFEKMLQDDKDRIDKHR